MGFLPILVLVSSSFAEPDTHTEQDLRRQLLVQQEENSTLKKELVQTESQLREQLAVSRAVPRELQNKVQSLVQAHADDRNALEQTQSQTTQTLINTDASITKQIEFEKQLILVQRSVASSNQNIVKLLFLNLASMLLVLCFLGLLLYPNLLRHHLGKQPEVVDNGGV